jgi:hypothetical protein
MTSSVSLEYLESVLPAASQVTQTAICATNNSGSSITVILGGTVVPLTGTTYANGISLSGNTITVPTAGTYWISYQLRPTTTISVGLTTSVYVNGTSNANLTNASTSTYGFLGCESILTLAANSTLQLYCSGVLATVTLNSTNGLSFIVVRIA